MSDQALHQKANVEIATSPVVPRCPAFAVKALEPIQGQYRLIKPGDFILIDPDASGADGRLVLVGRRLEAWCGQREVSGVATMIGSDNV